MPDSADWPTPKSSDLIISQLYEAAAGLLPWPVALTSLAHAFGAMVAQYVSIDKATGQMLVCEQPEGMVVDGVLDYIREYNRIDPHVPHMKQLPLGTVFNTEDVFSARRMASHPFYRDFWAPYGVRGMIAGKVDEGEHHYSCISIVRHKNFSGYTPVELALAASYVHHLSVAFKVARHFRKRQITSRVGLHLMAHTDRPMILLGPDRRVLFANQPGRDHIDRAELLIERNGSLHARVSASDLALQNALRSLKAIRTIRTTDATASRTRQRAALRLRDLSGTLALCTLWKLDTDHVPSAFSDDDTVLLSIAHPTLGHAPDVHFVGAMLDLTPAEAQLASQLVIGQDLATIAQVQGVSINTIKTHMRAIYAKTDTRRQAELIRLISRACAP